MRSSRLLQQLSFKTVVSVVMLGCLSILPQALLAQEGENAGCPVLVAFVATGRERRSQRDS